MKIEVERNEDVERDRVVLKETRQILWERFYGNTNEAQQLQLYNEAKAFNEYYERWRQQQIREYWKSWNAQHSYLKSKERERDEPVDLPE